MSQYWDDASQSDFEAALLPGWIVYEAGWVRPIRPRFAAYLESSKHHGAWMAIIWYRSESGVSGLWHAGTIESGVQYSDENLSGVMDWWTKTILSETQSINLEAVAEAERLLKGFPNV